MQTQTGRLVRLLAIALLLVTLVAAHGVIFYYASAHTVASAAVASGIVTLLVLKHVSLIGTLCAKLWRRLLRHRSE